MNRIFTSGIYQLSIYLMYLLLSMFEVERLEVGNWLQQDWKKLEPTLYMIFTPVEPSPTSTTFSIKQLKPNTSNFNN